MLLFYVSQLELLEKAQIVFVEETDVVYFVEQHGHALDAKTESEAAILGRIDLYTA